jgi:hypothetical protein
MAAEVSIVVLAAFALVTLAVRIRGRSRASTPAAAG